MELSIKNLSIGYGERKVQENISFSLQKGKIVALMGPNGVGKSTLLKTLMGLLTPLSGQMALDGRDLAAFSVRERAQHLCYMPQLYAPFLPFTVEESILMGRAPYVPLWRWPTGEDIKRLAAVIDELDIKHLAKKECTALSGGEQRMMLLARALLQEPDFLLLDEPATALDSQNEARLITMLQKLTAKGIGIIMATHTKKHAEELEAAELRLEPLTDN